MSTLGYADDAKMAAAEAAILAAANVPPLTDAAGKPLTPSHPLFARNPGLVTTAYAIALRFAGKPGGLLITDSRADTTLGAAEVSARTVLPPAKPIDATPAAVTAYQSALKAVVPAVEPVIVGQQSAASKGV